MKTKKQLQLEIEKLQKQLKEQENKDFIEIKVKKLNKIIRIYKWEDKVFKDFIMPKDFNWCEVNDFIYLYDNDLIKLEKYPIYYFCKYINNKHKDKLSRLYLDGGLDLDSDWDDLASSYSGGRVVVSKEIVKQKGEQGK